MLEVLEAARARGELPEYLERATRGADRVAGYHALNGSAVSPTKILLTLLV